MERSLRVIHHGNPKILFSFQKSSKFEFWLSTNSWNHHSFVKISPTLVIDTSMERPSWVLHHGNPKIWFFQKSSNFDFWRSWDHLSFVNISPTLVIDTSIERPSRVLHHGNPKNVNFFSKKVGNRRNWILSVPRVSIRREKKSPLLCQYQSYISNSYINGMVFEYYNMGTKIWFFFSKKFEIEFDLCWRAEINIQVGLTYMSTSGMHRRPFEGRHLVKLSTHLWLI